MNSLLPLPLSPQTPQDEPQGAASRLLRAMASPVRLQVLAALQDAEKTVSALLEEVASTQSNLSQHLGLMHKAGMLDRRRDGTSIYYRIAEGRIGAMCRGVCAQVAIAENLPPAEGKTPYRAAVAWPAGSARSTG